MSEQPVVYTLPVLPLKSAVLFPYLLMPLSAGRPASIAAVEAALATESKEILVFTQRDPEVDSPTGAAKTRAVRRSPGRDDSKRRIGSDTALLAKLVEIHRESA